MSSMPRSPGTSHSISISDLGARYSSSSDKSFLQRKPIEEMIVEDLEVTIGIDQCETLKADGSH